MLFLAVLVQWLDLVLVYHKLIYFSATYYKLALRTDSATKEVIR